MMFGDDLPTGDPRTWSQQQPRFQINTNLVKSAGAVRRMVPTQEPPPAQSSESSEPMNPLVAGGIGAGFGFILGFLFRRRRQ